MAAPSPLPEESTPPGGGRTRRRLPSPIVVWGLGVGMALAVLLVAGLTWLGTEHALRTVVGLAVERAGDRLQVTGVTGSLTGEVRAARVVWHDEPTRLEAEDVLVRFSPWSLVQGRVVVREAVVRRLDVVLAEGDGTPLQLPESLAPPLAVDVTRLAVGTIAWSRGERSGTLEDVALGYEGGADGHRVSGLEVTAQGAQLRGTVSLGARRPFVVDADLALDLASPHPEGRVTARVGGTLEALAVDGTSTLAGVDADARIKLAPFAQQPLIAANVRARGVDVAAFDASWPTTRLDVAIDATPTPTGFTGTLDARNALPGPLDRQRVPLASVTSAFTLEGRTLLLARLDGRVAGGAALTGSGTIDLDRWHNRWTLDVARLDLAQLHSTLVTTRLSGRVQADVQGETQRLVADVAQDDMSLALEARHDGRSIVAERFVVRARGGSITGTGRLALSEGRPFSVEARAEKFDPSRFGAFPAGAIDAVVRAEGRAQERAWAQADIVIAPGSRLAGLAAEARVRGRFAATGVEGLDGKATLGATRVTMRGSVNRSPTLSVEVASTRLAELMPLLPAGFPALEGALDARARLEPAARGARLVLDARAEKLRVGDARAASIRVGGRALHTAPVTEPRLAALEDVSLEVSATRVTASQGSLERLAATLSGSLASHTLAWRMDNGAAHLEGRASGKLDGLPSAPAWRGTVLALAAEDASTFGRVTLAAPADLEVAAERVRLGTASVLGANGRIDVDGVEWTAGRLATRGRFTGVAVAALLKGAGVDVPWPTDLVLGGAWDVTSTPQWRGKATLARERGDVYVEDVTGDAGGRVAVGLSTLALDATLDGPRLRLQGEVRAKGQGGMLLDATLDAPAAALHPFNRSARLGGTLRAHLPTLAALQPWIGTTARVQGQAIADVNLGGTLADPGFSGQLVGYALRVDVPQHGVHLADGRLRIVSSAEGLRLEELTFGGGSGSFTASGTIALPRDAAAGTGATRITWRANDFRALNHPDRRLIVDGEGTLGRQQGRWLLAGRLVVDEGRIAWRSTADSKLDDDIVVVGRPRPQRASTPGDDSPLDLDLAIELGRDFRFSAEGLDTRLAGKIAMSSRRGEPITARGTIRTVQGTYVAFGQRLTIDRGRLIFDGPVANPALDIVALRRNLAVEAGVQITGTARTPLVRLTSNPPVPDSEKLSWLLTGAPPGAATQREMIALQAAQAALAGRGGRTLTQQFAQNVGVDDISFMQRGESTTDDPLGGQVVSVGKRISDRLYVSFEQGLTIATNALRIEWVLSRFLTVSAFAGTTSGVELRFRRNWR